MLIPDWGTCPAGACRSAAASPSTPLQHPSCGAPLLRGINEGSRKFTRPVFPSPAAARMDGPPLGLPPRLPHPADQEPTTHARGGDRPSSTDLELPAQHHIR